MGLPTAQSMPVVETTHFYWSISENMNDYRARKERVFTTTMSIGPRGRNHPEIRIALTGLSRFVYVISGSKHTGSSSRTAQQRQQQQEQQPTRQSKLSDEVRLQTLRRRSSLRRSTNNINLQRGSSSKEKGCARGRIQAPSTAAAAAAAAAAATAAATATAADQAAAAAAAAATTAETADQAARALRQAQARHLLLLLYGRNDLKPPILVTSGGRTQVTSGLSFCSACLIQGKIYVAG